VNFCSSETILPILSQLGRNVANISNNHSLDAGLNGKNKTESLLLKNNISSFGDDKVEYRTIRGIKVALHGYNLLETDATKNKKICTALDTDKAQNNKIILSLHRGKEYASTRSPSQEGLAKYFIDCGADVIIGHHPHVIQDIQRYKDKPIIYSLGNFLFDQATPATQTGMIALLDIPFSGQIQLWIQKINTLP
jgi:poly-gamma-glutamate capsule biosynthesis protein CapA/YwtB (metallophosphatase superfamily)